MIADRKLRQLALQNKTLGKSVQFQQIQAKKSEWDAVVLRKFWPFPFMFVVTFIFLAATRHTWGDGNVWAPATTWVLFGLTLVAALRYLTELIREEVWVMRQAARLIRNDGANHGGRRGREG